MFQSVLKRISSQLKQLIVEYWIAPLDRLLWESVGLKQSSRWHPFQMTLNWSKDLGRLIYSGFRVNVSRWDSSEWSVVYISEDDADSEKELQYLFFSDSISETKLERVFLWQLPGLIKNFTSESCLVICNTNRLIKWRLPETDCIRVFPWLRAFLDISMPIDTVIERMAQNRKRDLAKIDGQDFEYCLSGELTDFEFFYQKMYLPYTQARFQERAIISSHQAQQKLFREGGTLLSVKYQNNLVAAYLGICRQYGNTFSALHLGINKSHSTSIRQAGMTALYWYVIRWAHAEGLNTVDFGRTRGRLTDGVFEFKRRWGIQHMPDITTHTMWTFIFTDLPSALIQHLNNLAFIAEVGQNYCCVLLNPKNNTNTGLSEKELGQREKAADRAGLDGLLFVNTSYK